MINACMILKKLSPTPHPPPQQKKIKTMSCHVIQGHKLCHVFGFTPIK